ncbi:ABC transporter permease [Microbacterium sp.]|uniref:ABC transporter permease n=1 Tax=Microbacterium sp. TaxID=51671 RepID=UPI0028A1ACC6|nr:ABC transporter permease [Microbacterium sp.]
MTSTLEHETTDAGARPHAAAPKPSRVARWRVATRLARRQVQRTWVSSLLIMTLIALPIAGMAGAAVVVASMWGTSAEKADVELGRMQGWVEPVAVPGAGFWQSPWEPKWSGYPRNADGSETLPEGDIPSNPAAALSAGTETVEITSGQVLLDTTVGVTSAMAWAGDVSDPRFTGRFDLVEGRAPATDAEVLVTPATLARTGTVVGGTITASGQEYTVVGTLDMAQLTDAESALFFRDADRFEGGRWYLPELSLTWPEIQQLNGQGIIAYSRAVVLDPPAFAPPGDDGMWMTTPEEQELTGRWTLVLTLAAAGVAAAYMVVMLAGAAFAVSARRQQRALAVAASVGADTRDLRRIVLLQGTVLGAVGGLAGLAAGVGLAALVMRLTDSGSATQYWGFHLPWEMLLGILVFAVLVGTGAALAPARGVAKADTIQALRGARRPQKLSAARPLWGSLLLVIGVGITIVCGIAAAAVATSQTLGYDSPLRWLPTVGIIVGPIIAQIGIVLSGRWLLWLCSRVLSKLGIAARIASRDAVANGARTVPAFAAIGATVFAGVFALGMGGMITGQIARSYDYVAPVGTAYGTIYSRGPEALTPAQAADAAAAAEKVFRDVGASGTAAVARQQQYWAESEDDIPADRERAVVVTPERSLVDPAQGWSSGSELADPMNNISVIAVGDLETVTGIRLSSDQRRAYEAGAALVTDAGLVTDGTVEVAAWTERDWQYGRAPNNIFRPWPAESGNAGPEPVAPLWSKTLDAFVVSAREQGIGVAIAPSTATDLGLQTVPLVVFGAFAEPPTTDQSDRLNALSTGIATDAYDVSVWIERGPTSADVWLIPLLAGIAVIVLGASAVALGLARFERRPDDATLAAVGGTALLRRNIGFWQGLVIAGFGTFAGAAAGILPPIGFMLQSRTGTDQELFLADIPWWLLAALAVALPLLIAVVNWLVPPRHPDLTRRAAIA